MKNKRVLAALLVAAMTLGLTACGGSDNGSVNGYLRILYIQQHPYRGRP